MLIALCAATKLKLDAETATEMGTVRLKPPLLAVKERLKAVGAMLSVVLT
jgi:hypothetical protein